MLVEIMLDIVFYADSGICAAFLVLPNKKMSINWSKIEGNWYLCRAALESHAEWGSYKKKN